MAAGRYGSYREREMDLKASSKSHYHDGYRGDSRERVRVDLRDQITEKRKEGNGYHRSVRSGSNSSGSERGRRKVEREPGELYSSSESPGDDVGRRGESPNKRRKVSPAGREKKSGLGPTVAPMVSSVVTNGHVAANLSAMAKCSVEQQTLTEENGVDVRQHWHDDKEPGEVDVEDGENAPARNILSSRWADVEDVMDDDEPPVRKAKKASSQSSAGASSETSSSGSQNKDGNDYMDVEGREDSKGSGSHLSDTDTDDEDSRGETPEPEEMSDPVKPTGIVVNMMQGCRNVDEFERLNKINEGTYGVVYRAKDKKTDEIVALKKVKMEKEREGFPLTSLREMNIMLSLQHPYIVGVKEVVVGSNLDSIFMVMEYMDHDLKALMGAMKQPFSQSEVKCLMLQLLEGVDYLHDNWVLHRDLKTSNILMNNCGELKICDFGLSRQYGSPLKPYTQLVVTLWYRSPELLLGAKEYSTAIDMWSVGCIMAELLAKEPLFDGKNELTVLDKMFKILGTPNEKIWPGFSKLPGVKVNFVRQPYNKLREKFPPITTFSGRPTLSENGFDLLNKLLTYDPLKRMTAKEALNHPWFREIPLPKSKEFMPTFPAQNAHDRCKRRIMKSPDPLEEQRRRELQQGELGAGGLFG